MPDTASPTPTTPPSPSPISTAGTAKDRAVILTEAAARRIAVLRQQDGNLALMLRLAVSGGGCSGFQYGFTFDDTVNDDDATFTRDDVTLVIDDTSLDLLNGSTLDFVEDLMGSSFQVRNPNATATCGCGSSFAA
ncbi:MAG: iron-sulfur cluster insertion protein ErpA [Azospirillaceae bacterium]|nr:iron-sulfur cluster insertion protein ErpA [Azospirillaceae bacterium]